MTYRLATYQRPGGEARAGLVVGSAIHDLADAAGDPNLGTTLAVLQRWDELRQRLYELAAAAIGRAGTPIAEATLLCPIPRPPAVFCAGSNYADHVRNMEQKLGLPASPDPRAGGGRPYHFLKTPRCCVGPDAVVRMPSKQLDWEGELVVAIGRGGRNIAVADAMDHVAGYMVGNDLSARGAAFRANFPPPSIFNHSFLDHKSFEGAAPMGPWLTPAHCVGDVDALALRTTVNGAVKQDGVCGDMIFSIAEQIAALSETVSLEPGDVIMTGTPAGVGMETGEFLGPGDRVEVEIEGLGRLATIIA